MTSSERRAAKRLSDRWLREEEKKSGRRLRIRISVAPLTDGYSSTPGVPHCFFLQYSEPRKSLLKTGMEEPLWHCGLFWCMFWHCRPFSYSISYDIHGLRTVVFFLQISGNYSFHLMYMSKTVPVNSLPSNAVSTQMAATWMRQSSWVKHPQGSWLRNLKDVLSVTPQLETRDKDT